MVSETDRQHFSQIAAGEAELNRESARAAGRGDPGTNVALGLALWDFVVAFGADLSRADEVAPIQIWRARHGAGARPA